MKETVDNPRGSVEKLSSKESVEGARTVLRDSATAPEGKLKAAKPRGRSHPRFCSRGFARGKSRGSPHTAPQHSVGTQGTLLRGQFLDATALSCNAKLSS